MRLTASPPTGIPRGWFVVPLEKRPVRSRSVFREDPTRRSGVRDSDPSDRTRHAAQPCRGWLRSIPEAQDERLAADGPVRPEVPARFPWAARLDPARLRRCALADGIAIGPLGAVLRGGPDRTSQALEYLRLLRASSNDRLAQHYVSRLVAETFHQAGTGNQTQRHR